MLVSHDLGNAGVFTLDARYSNLQPIPDGSVHRGAVCSADDAVTRSKVVRAAALAAHHRCADFEFHGAVADVLMHLPFRSKQARWILASALE
jgi:hypothetical protein